MRFSLEILIVEHTMSRMIVAWHKCKRIKWTFQPMAKMQTLWTNFSIFLDFMTLYIVRNDRNQNNNGEKSIATENAIGFGVGSKREGEMATSKLYNTWNWRFNSIDIVAIPCCRSCSVLYLSSWAFFLIFFYLCSEVKPLIKYQQ